jgi:hypothetical protein
MYICRHDPSVLSPSFLKLKPQTETPFTKSENREDERKQRNSSKYKEREEFAFASLSSKEIN